jgi:hypothetical protein
MTDTVSNAVRGISINSASVFAEGVSEADDLSRLLDRLRRYEGCDPALLRFVGGDRFPRRLQLVPPK